MLKSIVTKKWVYIVFGCVCALTIFMLSANVNPASSLFGENEKVEEPTADMAIKSAQEIRDSKTPVNPEGKSCYKFLDYLEANSQQKLEGQSLKEIKTSTHKIQEPVKDELKKVKDEKFTTHFESYFDLNDKYIEDILKTGEGNAQELGKSLDSISLVCSSPVATETTIDSDHSKDETKEDPKEAAKEAKK